MGSWNGTCAISNLHITAGQKVAVFMLLENKDKKTFCYNNAMYDLCPIPFYGEYDDYGAVENCHGFGMNIVLEAIRDRLYEFGQGPNSSHDTPVNKSNLDIDMLFKADGEDRLGIQDAPRLSNDSYDLGELKKQRERSGLTSSQQFELDRLVNKIKNIDTFRQLTHVIIHGDIFDDIMNNWYIEEYVGEGKGNSGYRNSYTYIYFKNIVDSIPEYIEDYRQYMETLQKGVKVSLPRLTHTNTTNLASKWVHGFDRGSSTGFGLVRVDENILECVRTGDWDGLKLFLTEALTGAWINSFMVYTRKAWTQTVGKGSQNNEQIGYRVLIDSMSRILRAEEDENYDDTDIN